MGTTATTDFCGITVEAAFGTAANVAAVSWTDITTYVRRMTSRSPSRRRDTDLYSGGVLDITLANRDRRFDPLFAAGPYYGNLKPRVQIRVKAVWSAVTYSVWYGYVDKWPQSLPQGMYDAEVAVTASDGFKVLNAQLPGSVWAVDVAALSPTRWYPLAESAGTVMGDISGNDVHGTYEAGATFNHRTSVTPYGGGGSIQFDGSDMNGTATFLDSTESTVVFWAKMPDSIPVDLLTFTYLIRQDPGDDGDIIDDDPRRWGFLLNPGSAGFPTEEPGHLMYINAEATSGANPRYSDRQMVANRVYMIAATYDGATDILYVNGVAQSEDGFNHSLFYATSKNALLVGGVAAAAGSTVARSWTGVLGEVVLWDSVLTPTNIADLYEAGAAPRDGDLSGARVGYVLDLQGWPASLRDIDTGGSVFGPVTLEGTALEYLQLCARSEAGLLYMAPDGDLTFVSRNALLTEARFTTSNGTFADRSGLQYEMIVTAGWDEESVINISRASRQGGQTQEYRDQTSIDVNGERPFDDSGLLVGTDTECASRAAARVIRYKDPAFRVESITLRPRGNTSLWPHVLGRLVGDRVTIQVTPLNVTPAVSVDCHISGITHQLTDVYTTSSGSSAGDWSTTWMLEPVDPNEDNWLIIGSGLIGTHLIGY